MERKIDKKFDTIEDRTKFETQCCQIKNPITLGQPLNVLEPSQRLTVVISLCDYSFCVMMKVVKYLPQTQPQVFQEFPFPVGKTLLSPR